ncbi:MAG: hypothetical protein ACYTED_19225 [Planctomycetota bacterium]
MRGGILLLLLAAAAAAQDEERPRTPINRYFHGKIVEIKRGRVTFRYDFEDPAQLKDFEEARPPHLLDAGPNVARIVRGRLRLERSSSLRHRMEGQGRLEARFVVNAARKGCVGTVFTEPVLSSTYTVTTIWDHRFYKTGAFRIFALGLREEDAVRIGGLNFRDVAKADPRVIAKQIQPGQDCEMEVAKETWHEWARVGEVHRQGDLKGKLPEMPHYQFGFWVHGTDAEFDDLVLTIEPPQEYLDLYELELSIRDKDPEIHELPDATLLRRVREAPLSREAKVALRELARRGPESWEKLAKLVRRFARKQPYAAVPIVRALAGGDEAERLALLKELHEKLRAPEIRLAILLGLVPWYAKDSALFHAGLTLPLKGRVELFRALVSRGLPDEIVQRCLQDELLAKEAYEVLRGRGADLKELDLGRLTMLRAPEGHSPTGSLAFAKEFFETRNWRLLAGLIDLLDYKDPRIAEGAYLLLLSVAGKDIPPDKDLWRSWVSAVQEKYEPPSLGAPGPVAAAILRGRAFLRRDLLEDGRSIWPTSPDWPGTQVGATALTVLALRAAGLPSGDAVFEKALRETLLRYPQVGAPALREDLEGYTYALSLLSMALGAVDRVEFKPQLEALALELVRGQLDNGQWTYHCRYADRPAAGDNSNTQFAILGLRAARRAGVTVPHEVWTRTARFWLGATNPYGGWGYGPKRSFHHEMSMTAAGIATLVICAEAVYGPDALHQVARGGRVSAGQLRLGELLLEKGYRGEEVYALYGVERACVLTGTRAFNEFDWYLEGARVLLETQKENGAWGDNSVRGVTTNRGYGEAVDTAFALLFLKRATTGLVGTEGGGVVKVPAMRRPAQPR